MEKIIPRQWIPFTCNRSCDDCGYEWRQIENYKSVSCPYCQDTQGTLQSVELERHEDDIGVDHYLLLSEALPNQTDDISKWEPSFSDTVPLWEQTAAWLAEELTESKQDIYWAPRGRVLRQLDRTSSGDQINVWFATSCWHHENRETSIACVAKLDGERIAGWSRAVAQGDGMNQIIGTYCACRSALSWASKVATILNLVNDESEPIGVQVYGDLEPFYDQTQGDPDVKNDPLKPLHQDVFRLANRVDASFEHIDASQNIAENLLWLPEENEEQ